MPRTVGSLALAGLIVSGVQTLALTQIVPGSFFTGRVVDNAGGGVPGVQVTLHRLDSTVRTTIQTNGTGHFNFQKIESGTYSVDFAEAHFRTQEYAAVHLAPEKAYDLRVTLQLGKQEEIVSGATDDDLKECVLIDLDVRDAQTLRSGTKVLVSGSLRDHGGRAIPGATLTFKAKRGTSAAPRTAISDTSGQWSTPLAMEGVYDVVISAVDLKTTTCEINFIEYSHYILTATLEHGDPAQVLVGIIASVKQLIGRVRTIPAVAGPD